MADSTRKIRVQELIRRVLSDCLHTRFQQETVCLTITKVNVAADHSKASVYYSVLGGEDQARAAEQFFREKGQLLWKELGRQITLKRIPRLIFEMDQSFLRGNRVLQLLDDIEESNTSP